jgi:pimeloyl-ACP methyl ester carboxylesterase
MAPTRRFKTETPPKAERALRAPSLVRFLGEGLSAAAVPRLLAALPGLSRLPRGHGEPVMLLPGFGAGDASNAVLNALLRYLGYRVHGWGLGLNRGNVEVLLPKVEARVRAIRDHAGEPVRLVGWSLGGVLAREVARDAPDFVTRVITMGTPVVGGPKYTRVAAAYRTAGVDVDEIERKIEARYDVPIRVPVTAIYCKADGIVDWRACIDHRTPGIEHIEVKATHFSLGFDPKVLEIVAETCAAPGPKTGSSGRPKR